jgi:hypothetical protein
MTHTSPTETVVIYGEHGKAKLLVDLIHGTDLEAVAYELRPGVIVGAKNNKVRVATTDLSPAQARGGEHWVHVDSDVWHHLYRASFDADGEEASAA